MLNRNVNGRINVKVVVILVLVVVALGISLVAARQVRRTILSKQAITAGNAAFEKEDWKTAYQNFQEYLGRHPDDVEILKKYAKARMSVSPVEPPNILQAIAGYRRALQLDPTDEEVYDELAKLYGGIGNFQDLAYIADMRLEHDPNDRQAPLWLADALVRLDEPADARQTLEAFIKDLEEALPEKHHEYVQACAGMSLIEGREDSEDSPDALPRALSWHHKAIAYLPDSAEARMGRARFYREAAQGADESVQRQLLALVDQNDIEAVDATEKTARDQLLSLARKDLETVDAQGTEDPKICLFLCEEWMAHGELDQAEVELQAAENLPEEVIEENFLDAKGFKVAKYSLYLRVKTLKRATAEGVEIANEALKELEDTRYRIQILPLAIPLYVADANVADPNHLKVAKKYLNEYLEALLTQKGMTDSRATRAYLQALVAKAEGNFYAVIDALHLIVETESADPQRRPLLVGLLAEAYGRTNQESRAVSTLTKHLRNQPANQQMIRQLAVAYSRLGDWDNTFKTAQQALSYDPANVALKLLRTEAGVRLAVGQPEGVDTAKLKELKGELAQLRLEDPNNVELRLLQATITNYLEGPEAVESELKQVIADSNEPLRAQMQLARYYQNEGHTAKAIEVCLAACERNGKIAEPWLFLSALHAADGNDTFARSCLEEGLTTIVDTSERRSLSIRLALLELMQEEEERRADGINRLMTLAQEDTTDIRVRTLLLSTRKIQEDPNTARELISDLKDAEGETGLYWRLHEASLWLSSDTWRSKQREITDHLQYCIDSNPQWLAPARLLVDMYTRLGDFKRVEEVCRRTLARSPSATVIAGQLLALLERQGRFVEAEQILEQLQNQIDPQVAGAWSLRMTLAAGDVSRAIEEFKQRISPDDQDALSRIQLAQLIYQQTQDADQAFGYLDQAAAIEPDSLMLTAARASILRADNRQQEARRLLDEYVADHNDFNAHWVRASYLNFEGQFEAAEEGYRKLTTFAEQGAAGHELLSNFYLRNDKLDEAIEVLEEGVDQYPENLGLQRRLMKRLFLRGQGQDRDRANEILTTLEHKLPQDPEIEKLKAIQLLTPTGLRPTVTAEDIEKAKEHLETAIRLDPTATDAHLTLFDIVMRQRNYETARDLTIRALGSNPNDSLLLLARGRAELALESPQTAIEMARQVLEEDPNNTEALDVFQVGAIRSGDRRLLDEARSRIESSLKNNPTNEKLLLTRAVHLVAQGLPQIAIPELEAYCQTTDGSRNVAAIAGLADLYRLSNDIVKADERIKQAEQIDPNNQLVIHNRLKWRVTQKQFNELTGISSAYISAPEQIPAVVLEAATILSAMDSIELKKEGIKLYEHVIAQSPTFAEAQRGLGSTLYQIGEAERARQIYERLHKLNPKDIQVLNDLAWILQEHDQRYEAALSLANQGLDLAAPEDPLFRNLLDTRGTILSHMENRLTDARRDFEKLLVLSPPNTALLAKTLLQLGRICARLNDHVPAKHHLKNAINIDRKLGVFTAEERTEIARILQESDVQASR